MSLEDAFAAYVRARMARALRRFLQFQVRNAHNDNAPAFGGAA